MLAKWKQTEIWKQISSMNTEISAQVKTFLENPLVMDKVETILSKAATSPNDFTLHDSDHSFRVANRMLEIIPETTKKELSEYDLLMMLLSAYLHDIGMTPEYKKIENHFTAITTDNKDNLNSDELNELQKWLDNENIQIDINLDKVVDIQKANELMTYYARYKHNDWSEDWINKNFITIELPNYNRWQNDLINICKSHHYGIEELLKEIYNAKIVNNICCHRRYVSMCLRIADVLEIDPERTPEVLFKHRNIANKSIPFWLKDQEISIIISNGKISFYARPTKAYLQKAIEETIAQIEYEINLCNNLIAQKPLSIISSNIQKNYSWSLSLIEKDVKPFEDSYVYIKGSFRPNIKRILELLGGTELYGLKIVALRELLQNSFDAVKEKIAYKRLRNGLINTEYDKKLGDELLVKISIEEDLEGTWLSISDQGVGMTKEIIENYFLVSGASQRHQLSELSRKCLKAGIPFERTGQFGIGVLSYFMIANKIIIKTKRSQDSDFNELDLIGWQFEISGLQDFSELKRCQIEGSGTEVRMLLKQDFINDAKEKLEIAITNYISDILIKSPCKIVIVSGISGQILLSSETGYLKNYRQLEEQLVESNKFYSHEYENNEKSFYELLTHISQNPLELNSLSENFSAIDFREKIKWEIVSGELPDNMGNFKLYIPYFNLNLGNSFYYIYTKNYNDNISSISIKCDKIIEPTFYKGIKISWKGFDAELIDSEDNSHFNIRSNLFSLSDQNFYCELDLNGNRFSISVDRKKISSTKNFIIQIQDFLKEKINQIINRIANENSNEFLLANLYYTKQYDKFYTVDKKFLFFNYPNNIVFFKELVFPFISWGYCSSVIEYVYKGIIIKEPYFSRGYPNDIFKYCELKLCFVVNKISKYINKPVLIVNKFIQYEKIKTEEVKDYLYDSESEFALAEFPCGWDNLVLITESTRDSYIRIVNKSIKNSSYLNYEIQNKELDMNTKMNFSFDYFKTFYLDNPEYSLRLLLQLFNTDKENWKQAVKTSVAFIKQIWKSSFGDLEIVYIYDSVLCILTKISLADWIEIDVENLDDFFTKLTEENLLTEI